MDPTTVILILALHLVSTGGLIHLISRSMPHGGLGSWAAGLILFGMAYVGRLSVGLAAHGAWVLLFDASMVLAALLFVRGLRRFFDRSVMAWPVHALLLGVYALANLVLDAAMGAQGQLLLLNSTLGVAYLTLAVAAWRESRRQALALRPALLLLTALIAGLGTLTLLRAIYIGVQGVSGLYGGPLAMVFYGYSSIAAVLLALNLLWLLFARITMRLAQMATRDALTETLNRNGLKEALAQHFSRREAPPLLFLLVDVDHFKQINDQWGHAVGDQALQAVAGTLTLNLRAGDFIARVGGEEFLIGCATSDETVALTLAERLRAAIAALRLSTADGLPVQTTASIGVSRPLARLDRWEHAAREADRALYAAKAAGRNSVRGAVAAA